MRAIQTLAIFISLFFIALVANADVILRPCITTQDIIKAVTDGNSSHYLLFYDSLDVSSLKVYNTLYALKTRRTINVDVLDIREPQSAWLRSSFEVVYVPMLYYVTWTSNGRKVLDRYPSVDFGSVSLSQFIQRH